MPVIFSSMRISMAMSILTAIFLWLRCRFSLTRGMVMDPLGLKIIFITFLVFVPLERVFALHPKQAIFRRHWSNDLIFLFLNGLLIKLGLLAVSAGLLFAATPSTPASFQIAVGSLPYWVQIPLVIVLSDLGF